MPTIRYCYSTSMPKPNTPPWDHGVDGAATQSLPDESHKAMLTSWDKTDRNYKMQRVK